MANGPITCAKRFIVAVVLNLATAFCAHSADKTLVLAAPLTDYPLIAAQMQAGAKAALPLEWSLQIVDTPCSDGQSGSLIPNIETHDPNAIVGLPCLSALQPTLEHFGPKNTPLVSINSRAAAASAVAVKNNWTLARIGPRENQDASAAASNVLQTWPKAKLAILDDGSVLSRTFADRMRAELEAKNAPPVLVVDFLNDPAIISNLVTRLTSSGVTHLFVAADLEATAAIATAAKAALPQLIIAGTETLLEQQTSVTLPIGTYALARASDLPVDVATKIKTNLADQFAEPDQTALDSFIATEIAITLSTNQSVTIFATTLGQMNLAADKFIDPVNYALLRFDGQSFVSVIP
jgi:branched-chain amino acid transport system substrate-binding protein